MIGKPLELQKEGNHMDEKTTQEQRLDYLVEQFKADSDEYTYAASDGRSSAACSG